MENKYKLFRDGKLQGVYSTKEMCLVLNTTVATIRYYAESGKCYKERYTIQTEDSGEKIIRKPTKKMQALLIEWDKLTEPYRRRNERKGTKL